MIINKEYFKYKKCNFHKNSFKIKYLNMRVSIAKKTFKVE